MNMPDTRRYHGLDALRGSLMMLGIVLHAGMFYLASPPIPFPVDRNTSPLFDLLMFLIHSFRMQTFFLLAGFFASLLVEKRGLRGAYADRLHRVLVPLLVACVTLLPVAGLLSADFLVGVRFGVYALIPDRDLLLTAIKEVVARGVPVDQPTLGHLWFLEYLCLLYLLIPLGIFIVRKLQPYGDAVERRLASSWLILPLGLCTAAMLWPFRGGQLLLENTLLLPHPPSLILFGLFFLLGFVFHHHRAVLTSLVRRLAWWLALAAVLLPVAGYFSVRDLEGQGMDIWIHAGAVVSNGFFSWALVFLSIACALKFFDRESAWIQYLAHAAYWVYLIHLPLVCLSAWYLLRFDIPAPAKFLIDCAFTAVASLLSFHYCVQGSWVGQLLHGRRTQLAWPWHKMACESRRR